MDKTPQNGGAGAPEAERRAIVVELDVPTPAWSVTIESVHRVGEAIWVVARLAEAEGMFMQVISTAKDRVFVEAPPEAPVKVFVLDKRFGWTPREDYEFSANPAELEQALQSAQSLRLYREGGE